MSQSFNQEVYMASVTFKQTAKTINSFVFVDLETTDLIRGKTLPRITELAMVAVSRDHLLAPQGKLPRVLSKLVIPINPHRPIPYKVSEITHLSNKILEKVRPFDPYILSSVMYFLQRLEQPICFVAHNGKKFDFPIFLKEFREQGQELPSDILAIDSIDAFRYYFNGKSLLEKKKLKEVETENGMLVKHNFFLKDSWDDVVSSALDSIETCTSFDEGIELEKSESFDKNKEIYSNMQRINETTPEAQSIKQENIRNTASPNNNKSQYLKKPDSMKLSVIFQHMTGCAPDNAHHAENDCLTLLQCANLIGDDFIEFSDLNAKPLISYEIKIQS